MERHNAQYKVWRKVERARGAINAGMMSVDMSAAEIWERFDNGLVKNRVAMRLWMLRDSGRLVS